MERILEDCRSRCVTMGAGYWSADPECVKECVSKALDEGLSEYDVWRALRDAGDEVMYLPYGDHVTSLIVAEKYMELLGKEEDMFGFRVFVHDEEFEVVGDGGWGE